MTDHFTEIYEKHGDRYHQLIAAEDFEGNLLTTLKQIVAFEGKRIVDLGSGTGRIPLLLKDVNCQIVAIDLYADMLREQKRQRSAVNSDWELFQADLRQMPLPSNWADVVTAGWAIGHFTGWYGDSWQPEVNRALQEMLRLAKPDGTLIILETMGTGSEQAAPPAPGLADYFAWLEAQGFARQVVSTDYDFGSVERAVDLCGFFFGNEMAEKIRGQGWTRVPEWTGIWSKTLN